MEMARGLARVLGPFIGCEPELVAFTADTTYALGLIALGLPWQEGDNVVTCDQEYPSNVYPWMRLEKQ